MPIVRMDIYKGFPPEYKQALLSGVHEALVHAFRIPEDDRNQIIREYDDSDFERSGNKTRHFVIIEITAFKGRSREAKRQLYQRIVDNLGRDPGIRSTDILITINEPELVNWGIAGGKCADETDIGFTVKV